MYHSYVFYINGMTCGVCSGAIQSMLQANYPIKPDSFNVDITTPDPKKTTVQIATDSRDAPIVWKEIAQKIEDLGYECLPYEYSPSLGQRTTDTPPNPEEPTLLDQIKAIITSHWFLGAIGCLSGLTLLLCSLFLGGIPLLIMIPLGLISVLLTLALGASSYYQAWKKFSKSGTLTMDSLFTISTLSIIGVSIAAFFVPWLPMMFEAGLLIYGFKHLGLAIEETIKEQISSENFQSKAPKIIKKYTNNGPEDADLYSIQPGDYILINPGEVIPLDGWCTEDSLISDSIIYGYDDPHLFIKGAKVLAGMKLAVNAAPLKICVTKTFAQSYLARLDAGIAQSLLEKAPIEQTTDKILTYFIPTVIALAIASGIIIGIFFPPALAIQCAISVLVSACPCTLGLIVPLAVKTGLHKAAENGIQFKDATALQIAASIDVVVIDLHGTLTTGITKVADFDVLDGSGLTKSELLNIACTLEHKSLHPIGKAVYAFTQENDAQELSVTFAEQPHHSGEIGVIDKEQYAIGDATLMNKKGIATAAIEERLHLAAGDSLIYLAREETLVGYFIVTQPLRKDAPALIQGLKDLGKEVHLCTGASEQTALRYAKALKIDKVYAECVGTHDEEGDKSKPEYIKALMKKGHKVAMIGDGANDAHAITVSDFGIAVSSLESDDITRQKAGAIVPSTNLLAIINAFRIAVQTDDNIKQNLFISLTYNLSSILIAGGILLTIGIALNPAVGAALMGIQACLILYSVYCFKVRPLAPIKTETEQTEEVQDYEPDSSQLINELMPQRAATLNKEAKAPLPPVSSPSPFFENPLINPPPIISSNQPSRDH